MQRKGRCAVFAALLTFGLAAPVPMLAADSQPADKLAATQEAQVAGEGTAAAATAKSGPAASKAAPAAEVAAPEEDSVAKVAAAQENEKAASSAAESAASESKTAAATGNAAEDISKAHWTTSGTKHSYERERCGLQRKKNCKKNGTACCWNGDNAQTEDSTKEECHR